MEYMESKMQDVIEGGIVAHEEEYNEFKDKLWADLKTDEDRWRFIWCGRAHETGIIAKSIQAELADAYYRLAQTQRSQPSTETEG